MICLVFEMSDITLTPQCNRETQLRHVLQISTHFNILPSLPNDQFHVNFRPPYLLVPLQLERPRIIDWTSRFNFIDQILVSRIMWVDFFNWYYQCTATSNWCYCYRTPNVYLHGRCYCFLLIQASVKEIFQLWISTLLDLSSNVL